MKYEAWSIMEPVIRANDGWAWFVGTPRGKNHLYKHYLRGQEGDQEWGSWLMKAKPKQPEDGKLYIVGADLAKHRDFTVLSVYDTTNNSQVYQDRFQGIDW